MKLTMPSGPPRFILTLGRIQDHVDPKALEKLVLKHRVGCPDALAASVCPNLAEARDAPYFYEGLIWVAGILADPMRRKHYGRWRKTVDKAMRKGRCQYYLGAPAT